MRSTSIVRARADWVRILEAAVADESDDSVWAEAVVDAVGAVFTRAMSVGLQIVAVGDDGVPSSSLVLAPGMSRVEVDEVSAFPLTMPAEAFRAFYYPPVPVCTHGEILRSMHEPVAELIKEFNRSRGFRETVGVISHPSPRLTIVAWAIHDHAVALSTHERRLLTQVALHLEAGYRARSSPSLVKAVLTADGRVVRRADDAPSSAVLESHGASVLEARSRTRRGTADAMDLWPSLLSGKLSLVPRGTAAKRHYEVIDNPPATIGLRALSARETEVLEQSARGLPAKLIAYALGVSPGSVSSSLAQVATKLGVASRLELLRVAALFSSDPSARRSDALLSEAEKHVLALLERGLSNAEIARLRSRSTRTIANQVASLLRKTSSASRRELVARAGPEEP
jgi:DNA-binding NarL/FixJ family response regulator